MLTTEKTLPSTAPVTRSSSAPQVQLISRSLNPATGLRWRGPISFSSTLALSPGFRRRETRFFTPPTLAQATAYVLLDQVARWMARETSLSPATVARSRSCGREPGAIDLRRRSKRAGRCQVRSARRLGSFHNLFWRQRCRLHSRPRDRRNRKPVRHRLHLLHRLSRQGFDSGLRKQNPTASRTTFIL